MIDASGHPRSFFSNVRKQSKLSASASGFTLQPGRRQSRLPPRALDDLTRDGFNLCRNRA
jgi:hypothetical protein